MIEKLTNKNPDSVQGETDAGPIEMAAKINEIVDLINQIDGYLKLKDAREEDDNN